MPLIADDGVSTTTTPKKPHLQNGAHHRDPEAPNVRLDTVAFLVEVRIDPLGLKRK